MISKTQLLDIIGKNGLAIRSVTYEVDGSIFAVEFHGIYHQLELTADGWRVISGSRQAVTATDVWETAQGYRERARVLDRLLGVLEDLGQKRAE